jgi:hypothetical protein
VSWAEHLHDFEWYLAWPRENITCTDIVYQRIEWIFPWLVLSASIGEGKKQCARGRHEARISHRGDDAERFNCSVIFVAVRERVSTKVHGTKETLALVCAFLLNLAQSISFFSSSRIKVIDLNGRKIADLRRREVRITSTH